MKDLIQRSPDVTVGRDVKARPIPNHSKLRIIKNVVVISAGILFLFIAYDGLALLQSTMNREHGIGVTSQAIIYICFCISALLFPKYVIKKLGSKTTFVLSILTYIPYIASNFYPHWILMIPTSVIIGLGASLLWGSQANYLNDISVLYAELVLSETNNSFTYHHVHNLNTLNKSVREENTKPRNDFTFKICTYVHHKNKEIAYTTRCEQEKGKCEKVDDVVNTNIGISDKGCELCIDGNTAEHHNPHNEPSYKSDPDQNDRKDTSSKIQKSKDRTSVIESTTARFFGFHGLAFLSTHLWSNLMSYFILKGDSFQDDINNSSCVCGVNFCNVESECLQQQLGQPSENIRYILTGICVCIGVISVLIVFFFLDPVETDKEEVSFSLQLLMVTYTLAKRKELILLIPSSFYIGMVQGFYTGDFTKSYIGCAWGTFHVGLVSACYGTTCGISSTLSGWLVKRLGRIPIFSATALVNVAFNIFLLLWQPDSNQPVMFFIAAGMCGLYVGTILSQLRAFYGVLFKTDEEAAFAAFHMWYSLGFCLSFAYSNHFCTSLKLYLLLTVSAMGYIGYFIVEKLHSDNKNKQ